MNNIIVRNQGQYSLLLLSLLFTTFTYFSLTQIALAAVACNTCLPRFYSTQQLVSEDNQCTAKGGTAIEGHQGCPQYGQFCACAVAPVKAPIRYCPVRGYSRFGMRAF